MARKLRCPPPTRSPNATRAARRAPAAPNVSPPFGPVMTSISMDATPVMDLSGRTHDDYLPGPGVPGMVSVVIPTYNRAEVVRASIESVLRQSWTNVEVVVVDDGSKDHTREVVEGYGAPVRYLHQANAGVSAARNTGLRAARGEFIALLDSDDQFLPWKLEAQVRVLQAHPDVGMVWSDMSAVDEAGVLLHERYLRKYYDAHDVAKLEEVFEPPRTLGSVWPDAPADVATAPVLHGEIFSQMLLGNLVHTSTVVLRRERLRQVGGFDTSLLHSGEDYEFHLRTTSFGPVALVDAPSLLYRWGANDQLTARKWGLYRARNNLTTVERWVARGRDRIRLPAGLLQWRLAQAHGWLGEWELEFGERAVARAHLVKSLRLRATEPRVLTLFAASLLPVGVREALRRAKRAVAGLFTRT